MAYRYEQTSGHLYDDAGKLVAIGYSGNAEGQNDPLMQNILDVGPIPQGFYSIAAPVETETHGPYVLALTPLRGTDTFGRSGFLIHGDSLIHPGMASEGCVIMPRFAREQIWDSGDHTLEVVA